MSLDNIQLNNRVVADLYRNALINLDNDQPVSASSTSKNLEYLGKNGKQILLLLKEPQHKYVEENDLAFLSKILSAVNLTLADVAIVNCHENSQAHYENLMEHVKPSKIIFFGVGAEELGFPLQFGSYKPQTYNGQVYLSSISLKNLQDNVEEKKKFWASLQQMFSN